MNPRIVLSQFWRDLKGQRLRTALTLFGLAWGTFCVVVLLSFGEGAQAGVYKKSSAMGESILLLWGSRTSQPYQGLPRGRAIQLEERDAEALVRDVPGVVRVSPEYQGGAVLHGPEGEFTANLSGVYPCFREMRKVIPEAGGRFLNDRDEAERRRVVVLGFTVREELFGQSQAVGQTVELNNIPFLVVGTLPQKDQDSNYNGPDDRKVFIPASAARASLGQTHPDLMVIQIAENAQGPEVTEKVRKALARIHRFDPGDEEAVMVWDVSQMLNMVRTIFLGFKVFLGLLGVLTLAIAGIGVANTMSMVVEDRTSQIGISMALGARKGWVLNQVLLETLCFTAVGGGLGILFASLIVAGSRFLPLEDSIGYPVFSSFIAMVTVGILGLIGIVSGLGPARRAANLNPAQALRA